MKKVYLVHGWGGDGKLGWFSWLKEKLKGKAEVYAFDMPNTEEPKIDEWVGKLEKNVKNIDKETFFVGHSIGCQTIMRFLEKLPENIKVGGCVFVAGWFNLSEDTYKDEEDREIAKPWIKTPIDFANVKKHTNDFLAIFSDDDPYVLSSNVRLFKEKLNARVVIENNKGHFTDVQQIKLVLDFILE